jgi:hypothetical protein
MPTLHIVTTDDGKKHKQFMTTYWCKLKEVGKVQQQKSVNQVVVAGGSFDDDDDDDSRDDVSSLSSDESSVAPPRKQGGGGGGGGKRGGGGGGGAGTTTKKSKQGGSKSKSHAFVKPEPNIKSEGAKCAKREPGASCGVEDLIEILSQSSADDDSY